jgi:uncharacterized membrane protein YhaH (DUF805 family)
MKPKRYWLRGGLIAIIIPIVFLVNLIVEMNIKGEEGDYLFVLPLPIIGIAIFFVFGSLLGWFFGWAKRRNI